MSTVTTLTQPKPSRSVYGRRVKVLYCHDGAYNWPGVGDLTKTIDPVNGKSQFRDLVMETCEIGVQLSFPNRPVVMIIPYPTIKQIVLGD